jgi:hypothetical protein
VILRMDSPKFEPVANVYSPKMSLGLIQLKI